MDVPLQNGERDLYQRITHLQEKTRMSTTMVHDLRAEVSAFGDQLNKLQSLEASDANILKQSLKHQRSGLDKLCEVLRKDVRDIQIIKNKSHI
jgi:hypothetical protein